MTVNIVMLAHNRPQLTWQAIETLYKNTPTEAFNLTVIDDDSVDPFEGSKDSWYDILSRENVCSLRVSPSRIITGQARNLGIYWAEKYWSRGDFLYLSDNDVYFTPGWLEILIDTFEDPRCQTVLKMLGGWNHPYLQPTWKSAPWLDKYGRMVATHDAVAGASQLMRWETWNKYGPFDAHAKGVGQSEDWKFCQDIQMPIDASYKAERGEDSTTKGGGRVGSIYPRVVLNCGLTNSFGQPSPGADAMLKELIEAKKQYPELIWE